jgi:perosamine synthetase
MVVQHMSGYPAEVASLAAAAGLSLDSVVEDAAHGLGAVVGEVPVGRVSRATCLSFYATKNLPIGEGGALCTEDDELAGFSRRVRLHGMSRDAWRRYEPGGGWAYSVTEEGLKANLSDVHAALGRGQLAHFPDWQRRRAELAGAYDAALRDIPGLVLPARPSRGVHAWHLYVVQITPEFGMSRDQVAAELAARRIGTSVHFIPAHLFPYFQDTLGAAACSGLLESEMAYSRILSLPMHPGLTLDDVSYVADHMRALCE